MVLIYAAPTSTSTYVVCLIRQQYCSNIERKDDSDAVLYVASLMLLCLGPSSHTVHTSIMTNARDYLASLWATWEKSLS